jgi:alpha-L-rhamnosidase
MASVHHWSRDTRAAATWGAAPENIIPRFSLGVRPLTPGFAQATIQPQPGSLKHVEGTVATIRGPIRVVVDAQPFAMTVNIPANMTVNLAIPSTVKSCAPLLDGKAAMSNVVNGVSRINAVGSGEHVVSCQ